MPRQANGQYLPPANTSAVSAQAISSTAFNSLETDIGTEITNSLDRQGRASMQANLPMGGYVITGHGSPVASGDVPNKAYVDAAIAAFFSTGDVKLTFKIVADSGWLLCNDQSIGNVGSGATYSNASALALFTLLWNNVNNAYAPVSGGRGGSALLDWNALKTLTLTPMMGRAIGVAGAGASLTGRSLGLYLGEEAHALITGELPAHTHANSITDPGHSHGLQSLKTNSVQGGATFSVFTPAGNPPGALFTDANQTGITITNASAGSGSSHNNMQPTIFMNAMIKL